jgi:DNA-binding phage protein
MAKVTLSGWDPAEFIETKEDVIANLSAALEDGDAAYSL